MADRTCQSRRKSGFRTARRTVPPGNQIALLPHAWLPARSRRHCAGAYLRAWRSFSSFEAGRSGEARIFSRLALQDRHQRPAQCARGPQACPALAARPEGTGQRRVRRRGSPEPIDVAWLEPFPDSNLEGIVDDAPNPEARYSAREAVQLAFVAAIQLLPPRQRAALLLCDVIGWTAIEAASLLGGSTASINSALQRARATLANHYPGGRSLKHAPNSGATNAPPALSGCMAKPGFWTVLRHYSRKTPKSHAAMAEWFAGRNAFMSFLQNWQCCGLRLVPTEANGQPAFAVYERAGSQWAARSIHVLTLEHELISTITVFGPPIGPSLFQAFGLPLILPDAASAGLSSTRLMRHTALP